MSRAAKQPATRRSRERPVKVNEKEDSTLEQIRQERVIKYRRQNERLELELRQIKKEWVPLARIRREVLAANTRVRMKLDLVGWKVAPQCIGKEPVEIAEIIRREIREALVELCFERQQAVAEQQPRRSQRGQAHER